MFELFADFSLAYILPFYNELKLISIIWLVMGTKLIFDTIINRELTKREKSIDRWLNKVSKVRDEIIASLWYEISRSSINLLRSLITTVLVNGPALDGVEDEKQIAEVGTDSDSEVGMYKERPMRLRSSNVVAQEQYLFIENGHTAPSSACLPMDVDQA